jgi:hypothetical protein
MGKTALWFFIVFIAFSFFSALFCWLYYLWLRKKKGHLIRFQFRPVVKDGGGISLSAGIQQARRPFLGAIKSRLVYDNFRLTEKFLLAGNQRKKNSFLRKGVKAQSRLDLPDIKEYTLQGSMIFFEDMLQLFSFPVYQKQQGHFYQSPYKVNFEEQPARPRQTEDADIRIEELRRVQGDYLNYKNFESGDDIRRIVWKVYARNRELVVRVPEQRDLYASHLYFFASFHTNIPALQRNNVFADEMLNFYKNRVWSVYETLSRKDIRVKYLPDQPLHQNEADTATAAAERMVSNSKWQTNQDLLDYFKTNSGSVLCLSSFNVPEEIAETLARCSKETVIYYVKLSAAFRHNAPLSWLGRIFLRPPGDRLKRVRDRWLFMPLRLHLLKREKEIEQILKESNVVTGRL